MEMTLRRLGLHQISPVIKNMGLPLGILMLVAMMVLPLPSFLLCLLYTSPSPRDKRQCRMPSSA